MMSLWDALRMNMMISYQELVRTFPNLFTGGYNYHGKHEFVTLEGMEKAVQVIVRIAELTAKRGQ
ncbi:hypothetical protein AIZ19_22240 [Salmonella enterica subsp. enterica serovar Typhimurium]|nr:hypothetical protein AIZ19_22240 [Salmonella enterica subsp. enterica serovar Typhimurium]